MNAFKKIISGVLILAALAGTYGFPQKAHAQLAVAEVGGSLWNQIITAVQSGATAISTYSLELKAFVLDTLATTLAKQLIRQITADVVNWINSGFEGSPAFITNPGGFFVDVADQVTGEFLSKHGGALNDLCSPFSIDIRLALAFKYHPRNRQKYACTLGKIIENSKNAVAGASINGRSINGFMNGDFSQGGWPAFVSLTTSPQNNPYGAYLEANSEIGVRVANAQLLKKDEISNGKGFLSWRNRECIQGVRKTKELQKAVDLDPAGETEEGSKARKELDDREFDAMSYDTDLITSERDCPIDTPGSLIVSNLETSVNGPLHELELVDSINEVVNALAAQLVNTVLKGGLRAISGTSASDATSYINQVEAEATTAATEEAKQLSAKFTADVNKAMVNTIDLRNEKKKTLDIISNVKNTYESAKQCYVNRNNQTFTPQINEIDTILNTTIIPDAARLLNDINAADALYLKLNNLKTRVNNAKTVNDINLPSKEFTEMLSARELTSLQQIVDAQREREGIQRDYEAKLVDAKQKLSACQLTTTGIPNQQTQQ